MHLCRAAFEAMDGIKFFRARRWKPAFAIACEVNAQASSQDAFVRGHPLHAQALRDGKNLFRYAALGRPNPDGLNPENSLMQLQPAPKLFARILWMAKTILRQGQTWR